MKGSFHQGDEELFGINAGNQCAANSIIALIFNTRTSGSCFEVGWDSGKMDSILQIGNSLYCYLHALTSKHHLLVSELPSTLLLNGETYRLFYGESISGDVNMRESEDCFFSLFEALSCVKIGYGACLLTVFCNTIAIFLAITY